uniref:Cadherin domain-containing protein n=1 Tax=Leptobrachium leishanense TaxID=445787 RepID=A0A8C5W9Y3_9ANUR
MDCTRTITCLLTSTSLKNLDSPDNQERVECTMFIKYILTSTSLRSFGSPFQTNLGAAMLSELKETNFKLLVQVKDMGDQSMGFTDKADLEIDVTENTWIDPGPVYLPENLKGDYPLIISQVKWDSTEVHYTLEGDFKEGLFTVAETGNLFITRELDRETQSQYRIKVSPVNNNNIPYSDSLEITLTVQDENDNKPVFSHQTYRVEITDKASKGSVLLTLSAVDADDKDTNNADIRYRIVSQEPSTSEDIFHLDDESGVLTLQGGVLGPGMAKTYTLEITATDRAGAQDGLSSSCRVTLDVMDLNDNPPVFLQNQFPPFVIAEDTAPGLLITTLTATDGDDLTDYKLINFSVQSGNEDGTFSTVIDQEHSTITIYLNKDLDYEKKQKYELILLAKNEAELRGAEYGPSSTATVHVAVGNVNEAPVFTKEVYEIHVPESTEPGAVILTVEAFDPDIYHGAKLHYSIHNDTRRWLSIQDQSGKIQLRRALDREEMEEATYTVQVVVTEEGIGGLSDTANVVMHVLDVNDNIPFLVGDYSREFFCSHRVETQRILIRAYDHDVGQNGAPFTFQAVKELHRQPKWKVDALNGTHAYLSMAISYLEPKVHDVPIILSDHGKPAQSQHVLLPVTVCLCGSSNHCITEINRMESMPTVSTAMGTLLGTLGVIVLIMIVIFTRLSIFTSNKNAGTPEAIPLKNTV